MAVPRGSASYKKKDGVITFTDDKKYLIWSPGAGTGPPVVSLAVASIGKVQQTPDTSPKVILKVFENPRTDDGEAIPYLFHYTSTTNARAEANAIRDLIAELLALARGDDPNIPKPLNQGTSSNGGSAGASAAMSVASAANAKPSIARWFDDSTLMKDAELQLSLLKKDSSLSQVYVEARSTKPESISDAAFDAQFWSNRVGLLRAHAIELNQSKGAYNILSTIKPRVVDGELKLSLVKEQVQMIFQQHPLVKRIYNENVPKPLSEGDFWSRFFLSRLSKKLRGERILERDGGQDPLFDKYSEADNTMGFASKITASQVPHIIDVEANEENQGGFKRGNRQDVEMRPRKNVPIIRTLNSLSEKIMAEVAPTDGKLVVSAAAGGGGDDGDASLDNTFQELALRDLRDEAEMQKIALNVDKHNDFFQNQSSGISEESKMYAKQTPAEVMFDLQSDMEIMDKDASGGADLQKLIGIDDDSDSDTEAPDGVKKGAHVGSRAARKAATDQIFESLEKTKTEMYGLDTDELSPMDIPPDLTQKCLITNATSVEFVKQFWNSFLSGDAKRTEEVAYYADAVKRSIDRIGALAEEAEATRVKLDNQRKQDIKEHYKKSGKKLRYIPVRGGKNAVMAFFATTLAALNHAQGLYSSALKK
ncbi:hypothetical protein QBC37DRAFT_284732 [Rhypophila decipiens]|uniref:BSD domain-containing protein n=1 Tax=Rhypophila decipiens TaxID=261697 RepID=A0AAN7B8A2_9PEZI|nr:hypothetical protein QBC37DRAFT_284732 [Rhypophila decipiens]